MRQTAGDSANESERQRTSAACRIPTGTTATDTEIIRRVNIPEATLLDPGGPGRTRPTHVSVADRKNPTSTQAER